MTEHHEHKRRVICEFAEKADSYAASPELNDQEALDLLSTAARVDPSDVVLDVACGPGVVACHLARTARHVTGIDLTPAMIAKAQELQVESALSNLSWVTADVSSLPFPDDAFSLVVSRYAFHHLQDPLAVLREMVRTTVAGGRVVLVDVCLPDDRVVAESFNTIERLRDPSHVRAFTVAEAESLFRQGGLESRLRRQYRVEFELEHLLAFSSAPEESKDLIRATVEAAVGGNSCGMQPRVADGEIRVAYPISAFVLVAA